MYTYLPLKSYGDSKTRYSRASNTTCKGKKCFLLKPSTTQARKILNYSGICDVTLINLYVLLVFVGFLCVDGARPSESVLVPVPGSTQSVE